MKVSLIRRSISAALLLAALPSASFANTLFWDGGVAGEWQNSAAGWLSGGSPATWSNANPDAAVFSGTNPTAVTLQSGGITAESLSFTSGNYSLSGGPLTLAGSGSIEVASGLAATLSGALNGNSGISKSGGGTLILAGSNKTYTGGTTITGGAIQISSASAGSLGNATNAAVTLNGGALQTNFAVNTTPGYAMTIGASGGEIRNLHATGRYLFGSNVLNGSGTLTISFGSAASRVAATGNGTTQTGFSGKWIVDGNGGNAGNAFLDLYSEQNLGTGSGDDFLTLQNGGKVLMRGVAFSKGVTIGAGGGQIANGGGLNTSISGKISGAAGHALTFDLGGSATSNITLSNTSNGWSGNTTLSTAGNLRLGASGVLPDAAGSIIFSNASAVLDMNGYNETIGGLSGNGSVDNTATATTSTLNVGGNNLSTTWSGTLKNTVGTLALVKSGTGALTLSGSNSYAGGTTVTGGTLVLTNASAVGTGGVTLNSSNATGATNRSILHLAGVTVNASTLTMNSSTNRAQLISSAASAAAWNGTITLEGSTGPNGNPEFTDSGAGGRLAVQGLVNGSLSGGSAALVLRGSSNANELAAQVSIGSTPVQKADNNTWTVTSTGNIWGNTGIHGGTLRLGASNALPTSSVVSIGSGSSNGTLDLGSGASSYSQTIAGLSTAASSTPASQRVTNSSSGNGTSILTVDTAASHTFNGVIQDGATAKVSLVKSGAGTLTLGGTNTFTGDTLVTAGSLVVNGSLEVSGQASVLNGATLSGTGAVGILTVQGTLAPGAIAGVLNSASVIFGSTGALLGRIGRNGAETVSNQLAVTGSLTLEAGSDLELTLAAGYDQPQAGQLVFLVSNDASDAVSGVFTSLNGVATDLSQNAVFAWNSMQWQISYSADAGSSSWTGGNDIALQAVPEPSVLGLLALAGLALAVRRRFMRTA